MAISTRPENDSIYYLSLSIITECDETNIPSSIHDDPPLSTDERRTSSSSNTPSSPLPPLIIEEEPNKHDDPEQFYKRLKRKMLKAHRQLLIEGRSDVSNLSCSTRASSLQFNGPDIEKQTISTDHFQYEERDTQKNAPDLLEDDSFSDTNNKYEGACNENMKELRQNNTRKRPGEKIVVEDNVLENRPIETTNRENEMAASFESAAFSDPLKSPILTSGLIVKKKRQENFTQTQTLASKYRSDPISASFDNMKEVTETNTRKKLGEEIVAEDIVQEKRPPVIKLPRYSNVSDFSTPESIIQNIKESMGITKRVNEVVASLERATFPDAPISPILTSTFIVKKKRQENFTQKASIRSDPIYDFNTSESTIENIKRSSNITKRMKEIDDRENSASTKSPTITTKTSVVQSSDNNLNDNENQNIEVMRSARVATSADSPASVPRTRANEELNVTDNVFRDTSRPRPHSKEDTLRESVRDTNAPNFDNTINSNILNTSRNGGHCRGCICNDIAFTRRSDLAKIERLLTKIHRILWRKQKSRVNCF